MDKELSQNNKMLPPPPPPPPPTLPPPPSRKQSAPSPLKQFFTSKQIQDQHLLPLEVSYRSQIQSRNYTKLRQPRQTNLLVWCGGVICLIFSIILILVGVATLVIFLGIKPKNPVFDTSAASLSVIYINSPEFFNGELTFVANFSNPNKKLDVRFEYLDLKLYFVNSLIAAQSIQPFEQRRGETRLVTVHMISSLVYLPPNVALHLQKQVQDNRILYQIRGTFRVRVKFGLLHFSYWLHSTCLLDLTSPPTGVLVARRCTTKRS